MKNSDKTIEILDKNSVKPLMAILLYNSNKPISQAEYIQSYTAVTKLNDNRDSKDLFEYFMKIVKDFLHEVKHRISHEKTTENFLGAFIEYTNKWKILSNWLTKIFSYLDRFYLPEKKIKNLSWQCMNLYRSIILNALNQDLFSAVNKQTLLDRRNDIIDRPQIKFIMDVFEFSDIENPIVTRKGDEIFWEKKADEKNKKQTLMNWFRNSFIPETKEFISETFTNAFNTMSAIEYIRYALNYLDNEDVRKSEYIKEDFHSELDLINYSSIIDNNIKGISQKETGFRAMLNNNKLEELRDSFYFVTRTGRKETLKVLTDSVEDYIKSEGDKLYNNAELKKDPTKFIPELLKFKQRMDKMVEEQLQSSIHFQDARNKAFSSFMTKEFYSRFLSIYCDYEMKVGIKGLNEKAIDDKLNNIINLFRCLNNKLVFQIEYTKKLTDRLIQGKTQSITAEKAFITKLKAEAGVTYVNKMTTMMQDLETSKSEMDIYRTQKHRGSPFNVQLNTQVLQQGAWEIDKAKFFKIEMPTNLFSNCLSDFNSFYLNRHKTHKLIWVFGLGTIEFEFLYLKKKYQAISTLVQIISLLWLEKYQRIQLSKLSEVMGLNNEHLFISEVMALIYHPAFNPRKLKQNGIIHSDANEGAELGLSNEIWINTQFEAPNMKISSVPIAYKKTPNADEENEKLSEQQAKTYRNIILDANITRIMKGRLGQVTSHVFLINEVAKQIDLFQAQPPQIKERIESLIEKNILKRNEKDRNCYEYVA